MDLSGASCCFIKSDFTNFNGQRKRRCRPNESLFSQQKFFVGLGLQTATYVWKRYIVPLLESGQLRMTIPGKPKSRKQRYYAGDEADAVK